MSKWLVFKSARMLISLLALAAAVTCILYPTIQPTNFLDGVIVVDEPYISNRSARTEDKLVVAFRPLVLGVSRQHTLDGHADAFDALDGRPAVAGGEQVEADDSVAVDVGMHGNLTLGGGNEHNFRRLHRAYISDGEKGGGGGLTSIG